mgnify:CR=1 FL=1
MKKHGIPFGVSCFFLDRTYIRSTKRLNSLSTAVQISAGFHPLSIGVIVLHIVWLNLAALFLHSKEALFHLCNDARSV